ncbi:MAG TPA: acyl-ACP thioesterase [Desulfuromonadales bacterium]|nr:acyl-ACP thioesterase [Desulfuromonadales bacterium]
MNIGLERSFDIRHHELNTHGRLRPVILLAYLQSVASEHATLLGVSVRDLQKRGLTWVLSRLHVRVTCYPRGGDQLVLRSWPVSREGLFTVRDFELLDGKGENIGAASTSWAVLDMTSRRPVKIDENLPEYQLNPQRALDDSFATLPVLENPEIRITMPVLRGDLDMNRHVNNTVYAGWGLEAAPETFAESCLPVEIEIGFRGEAFYGDTIVSLCGAEPGETGSLLHRIEHAVNGRELARLRTRWQSLR